MHSGRLRWVHIVPLVHVVLCLAAFSGYAVSALQPLGILGSVLFIVDFPVSMLYAVLAMSGHHDALALCCLVLAGTAWWYGLCRVAEVIGLAIRKSR
jgi:hypothetical protein